MQHPHLGKESSYADKYSPELLYAVRRSLGRDGLELTDGAPLPFVGFDTWNAYELSWRDLRGVPQLAVATLQVPCSSPNLVESKSLKLYLGGLYFCRYAHGDEVAAVIARDVGACVGAEVQVTLAQRPTLTGPYAALEGDSVDDAPFVGPLPTAPDAARLAAGAGRAPTARPQRLVSGLLRSLCPVTSQPDWADVQVVLYGARLAPEALLGYLLGFAEHTGFHEQCVERIFLDVRAAVRPDALSVCARYTRRGGIDINPFRSTPGLAAPPNLRTFRQ